MRQNNRSIGTLYEQKAGKYLESKGYQILEYNYRSRPGELDLIARDGEYLVFCEVKFRRDSSKGNPLEAVDERKQRKLYQCALYYMTVHQCTELPARFDVIGITGEELIHIEDAFRGN